MSARFETAIRTIFGDKILNDELSWELWSALSNVTWYHPASHEEVNYTSRGAGEFIVTLRGKGNYTDWYFSTSQGQVSDRIARMLKKHGWIYDDLPMICDEPGCLKDVSIWTATRATCSEHRDKS